MADLSDHQSDGLGKETVIMSGCAGIQYNTLQHPLGRRSQNRFSSDVSISILGHLADTFIQRDLQYIHTHIHTYIHTLMALAANQELFGVQYLARGHFNLQTR